MFGTESYAQVGMCASSMRLSTKLMQHGRIGLGQGKAERMMHLLSQGQRFSASLHRLIRIAEAP